MPADLVLALDGSTPVLSAALLRRQGTVLHVLGTFSAAPPAIASTTVPGCFEGLLAKAGATLGDVAVLVGGSGPGHFTGLRTALATMKAIAYARRLPLIGAGSLETLSLAAARDSVPVEGDTLELPPRPAPGLSCPLLDARKGEVYAALHRWTADGLVVVEAAHAPKPAAFAAFLASLGEPLTVVGTGVHTLDALPSNVRASAVAPTPSAALIALLALSAHPEPVFDVAQVLALEPYYLRPPEAEVARQKRLSPGT